MNTEEKAKAYNEVREKIALRFGSNVAEEIFSEFEMSEDEKTRKALISFLKSPFVNENITDEKVTPWIAWLEKQREPELYEDLGDYIAELSKQFPEVSFAKLSRIAVRVKNWLEKQGEQDNNEDSDILHRFSFYSYKDEPNILYLAGLYVNDEYRNKGIGTKILKIADEVAASMKCSSILLKTKIGSNAERLYKNNGYITFKKEGNQVWLTKLSGSANSYCQENCKGFQETGKCFADGDCKAKRKAESTDKIESKFHEDEWVSNGDYTWKIIEVKPLDYILQSQDGNIVDDTISHVDEQFHSFTIKDAKDGDILAEDLLEGDSSSFVAIYKKQTEEDFGDFDSYCFVGFDGKFYEGENGHCLVELHPATKEQRDLLFTKMKEADYEWSEETHELKKISQRTISAEAKEALYDKPAWSEEDDYNLQCIIAKVVSDIQNGNVGRNEELIDWLKSLKPNKDMVEALRTEYEKGKADGIAEMKKHIDIMDKDNIDDFAYQCAYDLSKDWLYENASWDDVQIACKLGAKWYEAHHKVQWSEEDERMIDNIIFELEENQENISGVGYKIDWLKQLKQRIGG